MRIHTFNLRWKSAVDGIFLVKMIQPFDLPQKKMCDVQEHEIVPLCEVPKQRGQEEPSFGCVSATCSIP